MSRSKAKKKNGLLSWILMLLTGSGAGAGVWQFRDKAIDALAFVGIKIDKTGEAPILNAIIGPEIQELTKVDYTSPGRFEVTVTSLELPPKAFPAGSKVDVEVRILKYDRAGQETVVWDTKDLGHNIMVVGNRPLIASWPDNPVRITWNEGDRLAFEVWNQHGRRPAKHFVLPSDPNDGFPFQPGSYPLARWSRNGIGEPDAVASVEFATTRLASSTPRSTPSRVARDTASGGNDIDLR